MKNRNLILSVLFWLVASVCMAITLPSSSYSSDFIDQTSENNSYVFSIGTQIMNHAVLSAYNSECDDYREGGWKTDINLCHDCCDLHFEGDRVARAECYNKCDTPLGMPLETPVAFVLALSIAYSVYRRKKQA